MEGAVASGVTANLGASLDEVCAEALAALKPKQIALGSGQPEPKTTPVSEKLSKNPSAALKDEKIRLMVRNPHGLHARPAARLITETRPFHSEITVRNLSNQRGPVSIRSLSSLAALEILQDNEIEITARGDDAVPALEKIARLVESGLGDPLPAATNGNGVASRAKSKPVTASKKVNAGPVPISSGIAIGPGVYFQPAKLEIPQDKVEDVDAEIERLKKAVAAVQKALEDRRDRMSATVGAENAGIYEAQILALQDPDLIEEAFRMIRDERINAAFAWDRTNRKHRRAL